MLLRSSYRSNVGRPPVLALGWTVYQLPGVSDLVSERTETAISTGGAGRTDIWSVAGTIYWSAPVLGVGYANFPVAYTSEVVAATAMTNFRLEDVLRTTC